MAVLTYNPLPEYLAEIQTQIEGYAAGHGLDFYPTSFEMVDSDQLHEVAAYGGFPNRYPHWRFGMEYEQLCKGYTYGLQKIYELVINNNPCYAYLLKANAVTDQKMVMAHVYGHCDFFKNNFWFSKTNRKMMDEMANHANRIRRHQESSRRIGGRGIHRRLPEFGRLDRYPLAVHQTPRRPRPACSTRS
ncbi:MAG: SpoVR family protein [Pirellulales bacterium]